MALSAYFVEDPITRIVSITINVAAGAVVVMAQEIADIEGVLGKRYVGRPAAEPPPPQDWNLVSANATAFRSLSYALVPNPAEPTSRGTPVYLLGSAGLNSANIHRSNDGEHWSVVHNLPLLHGGAGFSGIVWHQGDQCFYACWQANRNPPAYELLVRIYRSSDGTSWSLHQEFVAVSDDDLGPVFDAATEAFRALCVKPENKGRVPDGVQGYDPASLRFIGPATGVEWDILGIVGGFGGITIEVDGRPESGGAGLPGHVFAVSFAGKIWNALVWESDKPPFGIPTRVFVSADNGQNWTETFATTGYGPAGIVSGAVADVGGPS